MNDSPKRICCDVCGQYTIQEEHKVPLVDDDLCCFLCGYSQSDYALFHPDEEVRPEYPASLNFARFMRLWQSKILQKKGFIPAGKAYDIWREAHPELGKRFDMCNFQEIPDIEEKIAELWGVVDTEDDAL